MQAKANNSLMIYLIVRSLIVVVDGLLPAALRILFSAITVAALKGQQTLVNLEGHC